MTSSIPSSFRAVLLDPHPLWLSALESALVGAGIEVVGKTTRPSAALEAIRGADANLLVFDPLAEDEQLDGCACLAAAREELPALRGVAIARADEPALMRAAFAAGASAYLLGTARPEDVAAAVRQAFDRSVYLADDGDRGNRVAAAAATEAGLTEREREILVLLADGSSSAAIGQRLEIAEQTVKFHLSNLYRKLGVTNRTEASRWAVEHGVICR